MSTQNEMKGESGVKGEKGEPGGGYYDPRYGGSGVGAPGVPGPPVRSHSGKHTSTSLFIDAVNQTVSSCLIRALKETPLLAHKAPRGHLDHLEEGMMDHLDHQGHLDLQEHHWMDLTEAHRVS